MQKAEKSKKDLKKAAALLPKMENKPPEKKEETKKTIPKQEKRMDNLKDFLSGNPTAKAEFDIKIKAAKDEGKKENQEIINQVTPFLNNENYKGLESLALDVISGKSDISALKGAAAAVDSMRAKDESNSAVIDTNTTGETPAIVGELPKENGAVETEADFQASLARAKGVN